MAEPKYLDLAEFLLIAEAVLSIPAGDLARSARLPLAESALAAPAATFGGVEFYPSFDVKAAVLCARIIGNHPLPDGNKRVGYLALREFVARNGREWISSAADPEETVEMIEGVAAGIFGEEELAAWILSRLAPSTPRP